jgi:hypothetical protein
LGSLEWRKGGRKHRLVCGHVCEGHHKAQMKAVQVSAKPRQPGKNWASEQTACRRLQAWEWQHRTGFQAWQGFMQEEGSQKGKG